MTRICVEIMFNSSYLSLIDRNDLLNDNQDEYDKNMCLNNVQFVMFCLTKVCLSGKMGISL